ncbi:ATP-binding protein [Streptomyces sp. NPDC026673]|uniref:ATP-binding protein n=1 Tax=Streptomyces sp. NPDC026673 TaxID=3155724 RepID=UPI0033F2A1E8
MTDGSMKAVGWARSFPVSGGVRAGRRWAREHLASLDWTEDAPDTVDDVLLTVSELVTNAHIHAHSDADLVLTWDGRCLHVSVHDADDEVPAPRAPDDSATGGRGLALVHAVADHCHARSQTKGKTITACFTPSGGERDEPSHNLSHRPGPDRASRGRRSATTHC